MINVKRIKMYIYIYIYIYIPTHDCLYNGRVDFQILIYWIVTTISSPLHHDWPIVQNIATFQFLYVLSTPSVGLSAKNMKQIWLSLSLTGFLMKKRVQLLIFGPKLWNNLSYHIKPENLESFIWTIKHWNGKHCISSVCICS